VSVCLLHPKGVPLYCLVSVYDMADRVPSSPVPLYCLVSVYDMADRVPSSPVPLYCLVSVCDMADRVPSSPVPHFKLQYSTSGPFLLNYSFHLSSNFLSTVPSGGVAPSILNIVTNVLYSRDCSYPAQSTCIGGVPQHS